MPAIAPRMRSTSAQKPASEALRRRAERLLETEIDFIHVDEFDLPETRTTLLDDLDVFVESIKKPTPSLRMDGGAYWDAVATQPLLRPAEERELFRRWNFYKFHANQLRAQINPKRPTLQRIELAERLLAAAAAIRERLIVANLRLVVANARQFCSSEHLFEDLHSDGHLALIQAIEKFDYSRGFRFSTYATHAIRRTFFRRMSRKQRERQWLAFAEPEVLQTAPAPLEVDERPQASVLYQRLMDQLRSELDERELQIVRARFNLDGGTEPPTLQTLAGVLGICKERVRQLQIRALEKLRTVAERLQSEIEQARGMMCSEGALA